MLKKIITISSSILLLSGLAMSSAHADVKLKMHMTMDSPMMKNMPPQAKAMMDKFMNMTEYFAAKKTRVDSYMINMITDMSAEKMFMINNNAKKYSVTKLDAAKMKAMMSGNGGPMGGPNIEKTDVKITETGNTKVILGHKCKEYIITAKMKMQQQDMTTKSSVYSATDLGMDNPYAESQGDTKVSGIPLLIKTDISGGMADGTSVTMTATELSTDPIPASTFEVPSGYKEVPQNELFGGMGRMSTPPTE